MSLGPERLGIVEEGQRRSALYSRHVNRCAPAIDERQLARLVEDAVATELQAAIGKVVAEQVARLRLAVDARRLSGLIERIAEAHVRTALDAVVAERVRQAVDAADSLVPQARIALQAIVTHVATATGVTVPEILGPRRARQIAEPRQLAYWLVRRLRPDLSLLRIARVFNRDHTSVIAGARKVDAARQAEPFRTWLAAPAIVALLNSTGCASAGASTQP